LARLLENTEILPGNSDPPPRGGHFGATVLYPAHISKDHPTQPESCFLRSHEGRPHTHAWALFKVNLEILPTSHTQHSNY
jgi:hypothetical protein